MASPRQVGVVALLRHPCCASSAVVLGRRVDVVASPCCVGVVASSRCVGDLAMPCRYCSVAVPSWRRSHTAGLTHCVSPRWRWQLWVCARQGGGHPFET
ncbi:hypothetical protein EDB86DRAFT_2867910 [Lactarius hatsudake]|nr:hypothetical protein EDB86DRAFT_2867910 [Lactarius hatsudake]